MSTETLTATTDANVLAAAASGIPAAPPFCPPWQKFRSPATNPPGFWTAVSHDVWTGGLVMQLGTVPHGSTTPLTRGSLSVGYFWQGYLCAGWHSLTFRFQFGPVTLRPNGGSVSGKVFASLGGPSELPFRERKNFYRSAAAASGACIYLTIHAYLEDPGTYKVYLGGQLDSEYSCSASPYGEIIVSRIEVQHCGPAFQAQALGAAQGMAPLGLAELRPAESFDEAEVQLIDIDPEQEPRVAPLVQGV